jgi:hypothetical protein
MDRLFAALPTDYQTLGTNQYVGILHTQINSSTNTDGLQLMFTEDAHYCGYFADHPSSWRLWISDPLRAELRASHPEVSIDDKPMTISMTDFDQESLTINLPSGLGTHVWKLKSRGSE